MFKSTSFLCLLGLCTSALAAEKPNIVLFYADDLDFDEVPLYDQLKMPCLTAVRAASDATVKPKKLYMPNLERLGREGAVFTNFYITSPICTPSRYSLLTGRYASRSPGFCQRQPPGTVANIRWNTPLAPDETNIAKALKACGYATGFVGKWHNEIPGGAVRGITTDMEPDDPRVARAAQTAQQRRSRYLCDQIGFDYAARIYLGNKEQEKIPEALRVHNLAWLAEGAVNFICQDHGDRPFFLYLPVTIPHAQYNPEMISDDPLATIAGMLEREPTVMPPKASVAQRAKAAGVAPANFAATWLDDCVGAVMKSLDDLGLTDNTVFVFVSDHQSRGKYTCYEGARVPMIVRWPGQIARGTVNNVLSANIDLPPTFVEIAGGEAALDVDGRSLVKAWKLGRQPDDWRTALLLECSLVRAVVTQRWKYLACRPTPEVQAKMDADAKAALAAGRRRLIDWSGNENPHPRGSNGGGIRYNADKHFPCYFDVDQLYDLQNDVIEQKNVASLPENSGVLRQLQQQLRSLLNPLPHTFGEFKTN